MYEALLLVGSDWLFPLGWGESMVITPDADMATPAAIKAIPVDVVEPKVK
jgi:hypothetical protein